MRKRQICSAIIACHKKCSQAIAIMAICATAFSHASNMTLRYLPFIRLAVGIDSVKCPLIFNSAARHSGFFTIGYFALMMRKQPVGTNWPAITAGEPMHVTSSGVIIGKAREPVIRLHPRVIFPNAHADMGQRSQNISFRVSLTCLSLQSI
jgi:hypothetical protein